MRPKRFHIPNLEEYRNTGIISATVSAECHDSLSAQAPSDASLPLVSIITPVRNASSTLSQTIASVVAQSYPHIEYIVVDGGSIDGTLDLLHAYDNAIDCWVSEPDDGISDAFNKGISLANGDIVGILNADDWYEPGAVTRVVDVFAERKTDIVCGALQYWLDNERSLVFYSNPENLLLESTVNHPSVFVRRQVYETLGLFSKDLRYAMDYEFLLRCYQSGVRFSVIDDVLANMRFGGASDGDVFPVSSELYRIKSVHLGRPWLQACYSAYHYTRTHVSKFLRKTGADGLLNAYRRRFSVVKKSRTSSV